MRMARRHGSALRRIRVNESLPAPQPERRLILSAPDMMPSGTTDSLVFNGAGAGRPQNFAHTARADALPQLESVDYSPRLR